MNYKSLIKKVYEHYTGEINSDELNDYFVDWAEKNKYPMPKRIRLYKDTAWNCEGDIIPIVEECENNLYYNDSMHRWCYIEKKFEGDWFEYVK